MKRVTGHITAYVAVDVADDGPLTPEEAQAAVERGMGDGAAIRCEVVVDEVADVWPPRKVN